MAISQVQLFTIPVKDQDRAKGFYCDTLGLELLSDNPMGGGQRWVQVRPPGAQTSITLVTWFEAMPPGSVRGVVLQTDDVDADYARLREEGVEFATEPTDADWGRYVTLSDPDGNGLILATPPAAG